jgi:hypothetical protein
LLVEKRRLADFHIVLLPARWLRTTSQKPRLSGKPVRYLRSARADE